MVGCWQAPAGRAGDGWEVDRSEVDLAVRYAFDRWDVSAFYADIALWESYIDSWRDRYGSGLDVWATSGQGKRGHAIAWDMRSRVSEFTFAAERFVTDVAARSLTHDGDSRLAAHVANARRNPNRWGVSIRKEGRESPRKIDLAVGAVGARKARADVLAVAANKPTRVRTGEAFFF